MARIAEQSKIVTDPVVLSALMKQGIDKHYVEFDKDYGSRSFNKSPYMKGYRDLLSNKRFAVFSGLPMCDMHGHRIELPWVQDNGIWHIQYNLFDAKVANTGVTLVCLADQPNRTRLYDQVVYHPQLFIGGSEVHPISPVAIPLETDPINKLLHYNVLEWDYGVCKRRIRIIQGRFRERWIFSANPNGKVKIKHNTSGRLQLKFGTAKDAVGGLLKVTIIGDEEIIEASEFDKAVFPVEIGGSLTVYPDEHVEDTSVDGYASRGVITELWATQRVGAGMAAIDDAVSWYAALFDTRALSSGYFKQFARGITLFDSSALTGDAEILDGVTSLFGAGKADEIGMPFDLNVYSSSPNNNDALQASDFNIANFGSTPFSNAIAYGDLSITGYNDFTLNADGKAAISKTGITKFGFREATHDAGNTAPSWSQGMSYILVWAAEKGNGFKPKLVVTYELWLTLQIYEGRFRAKMV